MAFMLRCRCLAAAVGAVLLAGCSDTKPAVKSKEPEKPAEPVTGQSAFWKMYMSARGWSPDVQPVTLRNMPVPGIKAEGGKAGAWEAIFVSQAKGQSRTYTYSVIEVAPNLHKDVFPQVAEAWGGPSGQQKPWPIPAFKVDSDKAYEAALEQSKEYVAKNKDKSVNFLLEQTPRNPDLTWRVYWGETISTSNYSIVVDASTGKVLERLR
jgi:hypothetical protein